MDVLRTNTYEMNKKNLANGLELLSDINDSSISVTFFDPQYRGVLDRLKYCTEMKDRREERQDVILYRWMKKRL